MADGIKIGNLDISAFKVGSDDCKVYLGDTLLYPNVETRVIATFNVTDTSEPTQIINEYSDSPFSAIEIDGVEQQSVVSEYTFDTVGEHTVKYTLTDSTSIGYSAFRDCTSLTSIVIPNNVTNLVSYTFRDCKNLTSITISDSVTNIGEDVFNGCSGLTSIDIPSGVTSIGSGAFEWCSSLTSITIPDNVTSIGAAAFYYCSSLRSIIIPDSITEININICNGCSSLTSCTIGSGVTRIGFMAFSECKSLTSITCLAVTPPSLESSVFSNTNNCPIYVPSGSVNAYKAASSWSSYTSRIQAIP